MPNLSSAFFDYRQGKCHLFRPSRGWNTKTPQAFLITENVPAAIILKTKSGLFEHAKFLAHLDEGGDTLVELLAGSG